MSSGTQKVCAIDVIKMQLSELKRLEMQTCTNFPYSDVRTTSVSAAKTKPHYIKEGGL